MAVGGEDDSIAIYSVAQRRCIVWGEGHGSWVSAVQWDATVSWGVGRGKADGAALPCSNPPANGLTASELYRVVSVGQDCRLGMWDVDASDEMMGPLAALQPTRYCFYTSTRVSTTHCGCVTHHLRIVL